MLAPGASASSTLHYAPSLNGVREGIAISRALVTPPDELVAISIAVQGGTLTVAPGSVSLTHLYEGTSAAG